MAAPDDTDAAPAAPGERRAGGALVVVPTPIGNLADLSPRGREALAAAGAVACEDTRRTGALLHAVGLAAPPLLRVDAHTEADRAAALIARVEAGERVALVTDAGTPGISDPGAAVVRAVLAAGLPVEVLPGPVAAVVAVVASGLDTSRVALDGFLPRKGPARAARLAELAVERRTVALHEAPGRVGATLADLARACGPDRRAAVARELTKLHEEVWRGTLDELAGRAAAEGVRGEVVIVVAGRAPDRSGGDDDEVRDALRRAREEGLSPGRAAAEVAVALGRPRREVYEIGLALLDPADPGAEEPSPTDEASDEP